MRTIKITSCHPIAANEKYVCLASGRLYVYSANDFRRLRVITGLHQTIQMAFLNESTIIVKSIFGTYRIVDVSTGECLRTIKNKIIENGGQSVNFTLSSCGKYILDVLTRKNDHKNIFCKIDIDTGNLEWAEISEYGTVINELSLDIDNDRALFMSTKLTNGPDGYCAILSEVHEADYSNMRFNIVFSTLDKINSEGMRLLDNRYILKKDASITDFYEHKVIGKLDFDLASFLRAPLFQVFFHSQNGKRYLVLVTDKNVAIFDFDTREVVCEYGKFNKYYGFICACIVGNHLLLSTDLEVIILDNPLNSLASKDSVEPVTIKKY